jgi:DNA-binding NtrC family response regulator
VLVPASFTSTDSLVPESALIGVSSASQRLRAQLYGAAKQPGHVLLRGEPGTGKGLAARTLHAWGSAPGPFVRLSPGKSPGDIAGSLADEDLLVRAFGGTLLIDDLADLPHDAQVGLCALLDRAERQRGGLPFRIVAATRRDLESLVRRGALPETLLGVLGAQTVWLPPLRARPADVPPLGRHFVAAHAKRLGRDAPRLTDAAVAVLAAQRWPGNIRQLEEVMGQLAAAPHPAVIDGPDVERRLGSLRLPANAPGTTVAWSCGTP